MCLLTSVHNGTLMLHKKMIDQQSNFRTYTLETGGFDIELYLFIAQISNYK